MLLLIPEFFFKEDSEVTSFKQVVQAIIFLTKMHK